MQLDVDLRLRVLGDDVLEEEDSEIADVGVRLGGDGADRARGHRQLEVGIGGRALQEAGRAVDELEMVGARNVGEQHADLRRLSQMRGRPARRRAALEKPLQHDVRGLGALLGRHPGWKLSRLL